MSPSYFSCMLMICLWLKKNKKKLYELKKALKKKIYERPGCCEEDYWNAKHYVFFQNNFVDVKGRLKQEIY